MMLLSSLVVFSLASAAETAALKATVGEEVTLIMDALPESTTDFHVLKAEQKGGKYLVTALPLSPGLLEFNGQHIAVGEPDLPNDATIKDIKAPLRAWPALWPWVLLALLGVAAHYARREWLRRKGVVPAAAPQPVVPLEFRVERRLKELEGSGLWEKGEHAAYYLRLTEILRGYLEERWGVPATAMTSLEVSRLVKARGTLAAAGTVRQLLERADLVKFARQKPGEADGPRDLEEVRRFVFATSPGDLAAQPAGAKA